MISFTKRLLTNQTNELVLIATCKQLVWSTRIGRNMTIWILILVFPVCVIIMVKTPLSSQVGNIVLIDVFNVFSRSLSIILFLRASCRFPAEKKTHSIPPPNPYFDTVHTGCQTPTWNGSVSLVRHESDAGSVQDSQSSSESIVLTHLCASKIHSTPGHSMTWLWVQYHCLATVFQKTSRTSRSSSSSSYSNPGFHYDSYALWKITCVFYRTADEYKEFGWCS
jgi:hypothetical protein